MLYARVVDVALTDGLLVNIGPSVPFSPVTDSRFCVRVIYRTRSYAQIGSIILSFCRTTRGMCYDPVSLPLQAGVLSTWLKMGPRKQRHKIG